MENKRPPAVICRDLKKSYGIGALKTEVLHGIDFEVKPGELLMLVGPSGSGKTTLISIIATILSFDSGECTVLGRDIQKISDKEKTLFRGRYIGFIFQAFNLIPMLTAQENTILPLLLTGIEREEAMQRAAMQLTKLGLEDKVKAYPPELSGGQQQRVAIARAIIHTPDLIVCDEPTSNLDQENGMLVLQHLRDFVDKESKALIVVTHDPRIFDFADRILKLEDGRIVDHHDNHRKSSQS